MTTKTNPPQVLNLAEMSFKEVATEWKRQRRDLFLKLNKTMTLEEIGKKYKLTRQAVGVAIRETR